MSRRTTALAVALFAAALGVAATPAPPPTKAPTGTAGFTETIKSKKAIPDGKDDDGKDKIKFVDGEASFDMVYLPGGEYTMGSPETEAGRDRNEGPAHRVKVGPLWLGKCEVTWDAFDLFWFDANLEVAAKDKDQEKPPEIITRPTNAFVDETYDHGREGHPVVSLSHHSAMVFCNWLRSKTGKPYRLPTEAEWEYAARAGTDTPYSFGTAAAPLEEYAWYKANSPDDDHAQGTTHKVGTKKANPLGLHDLYGNVWEWTLDQFDPKAYERGAASKLSVRPVVVPTAEKWSHVVRGGSWADKAERCRSAARRVSDESWMKHDPQDPQSIWWLTRMDVIGFRVALAADEQPELVGLYPKVKKFAD